MRVISGGVRSARVIVLSVEVLGRLIFPVVSVAPWGGMIETL